MIIVHVVEPFAAGVAVFVKSLSETMPDDTHIIIHGERRELMPATEVKKIFPKKNVRFIQWRSAQRSINLIKDSKALLELYSILSRLKKKDRVDAVHLHSAKSGLLGRLACRFSGISNVIYTPNGAPFLSGSNPVANSFYKILEKWGSRLGGAVICCSPSEQAEYTKLGIETTYINNGIQLMTKSPAKAVGTKDKKFRVITSGRIVAQKDPRLFNTIARYFEEFSDFEFLWVGDGDDRGELTAGNIKVTGWLHPQQAKALVEEADVYISTSLYEGMSFALLEALALGKPVLVSNCTGNKDVVHKGLNGDVFTNATEAIIKIIKYQTNQDMMTIMSEHAQAVCASSFDMHRNFSSYKEAYNLGRRISILPADVTATA